MVPSTLILDIDGTIFKHSGNGATEQWFYETPEVLPGVYEFLNAAERDGCCIVLMTARKESCREVLQIMLHEAHIPYDQLIMGVTHGTRVLINDHKADGSLSVDAFSVPRNQGLEGLYENHIGNQKRNEFRPTNVCEP